MTDIREHIEPVPQAQISHESKSDDKFDEKLGANDDTTVYSGPLDIVPVGEEVHAKNELELNDDELAELEEKLSAMSLEHTFLIANQLWKMHRQDQNFPQEILNSIEDFINNQEVIEADPASHAKLIRELKLECILATENSPYLEVRANVESTDDPTMPSLTFRVLLIGTLFAGAGSFIDNIFALRQPPISVGPTVGQLLAYPFGKWLARIMPTRTFRLFGREFTLNPGPFNRKEHMLITIMCNVSLTTTYMIDIVPVQALPVFFDQPFARQRGYQFLNNLGICFVGYGFAGLTRRFLVWPSFAVWPGTLNNLALVKAFHTEQNEAVRGPFGLWTWSREKFFLITFAMMLVWYWFPGYIFQALSSFSWIAWIAPNNVTLDAITGMNGGVGINPWTSFDWNIASINFSPLTIPSFTVVNLGLSLVVSTLTVLGVWFSNKWDTGYFPILQPGTYDNMGMAYNVTRVVNPADGRLDETEYQQYSMPYMTAGTIVAYIFYFVLYTSAITYVILFHRHEVGIAFKGFYRSIRRQLRLSGDNEDEEVLDEDIHARLMRAYPDVPEWVYFIVLLIFAALGMLGVGIYKSDTSPVVMVFGVIMTLLTIIPVGLVQCVTGIPVPTNVLAEFIGGALVSGDGNALMYFKTYGYISCYQAMSFSNDLKLAHYSKIPPWSTFWAQMWATLVYVIVSSSLLNFLLGFKDVCTENAAFHLTCPGNYQYFTATVFWGTLGPKHLFGPGKRYNTMLIGFPIGVVVVLIYWAMRRKFPRWAKLRQIHPVVIAQGIIYYAPPYNLSYYLPLLYITLFSFQYIRPRYTQLWAKYNYVLAASFPAGVAITSLVIFFALEIPKGGININWWGNTIISAGCEAGGCPRLIPPAEPGYFGPPRGSYT